MTIEHINPNLLSEHPDNPRTIKTGKFKDLCESIKRNPDYFEARPILATPNNVIFAGTMRWRAAKEIGMATVPVVVMDISEERQKEIMVRDNQSSGEWDIQKLSFFAEPLLIDAGFSKVKLHDKFALFREAEDDGFDAEAELGKIQEPKTKVGDVIWLGRHILMCGDATCTAHVEKLMLNERADMVFTDPPYNIDYENTAGEKIMNDKMTGQAFELFLTEALKNAHWAMKPSATIYVCHADWTYREFLDAFRGAGFHWHQTISWLKERFTFSGTHYQHINERILYGWKEGETPYMNETLRASADMWDLEGLDLMERLDVWKVKRDANKDRIHGNQKPVKLLEIPMRKSLPHDGIVLDLFAGGGSTLIAAEQMGGQVRLMELDPRYCDVIRERWRAYQEKQGIKTDES